MGKGSLHATEERNVCVVCNIPLPKTVLRCPYCHYLVRTVPRDSKCKQRLVNEGRIKEVKYGLFRNGTPKI